MLLLDTQNSETAEREGIEHLYRQQVDGIIWCPLTANDVMASYADKVPVVVIDRPMPNYDSVSSNYTMGGSLLAKHLLSQGHKSIGMVTGPETLKSAQLRKQGFTDTIDDLATIVWSIENEFSITLNDKTKQHIQQQNVSVIVAGNDMTAIGVMAHLKQLGKQVPDDVSVVGFDDIPWCNIVSPTLTSIRQPLSQIGREAINVLLDRINQSKTPKRHIMMDVNLTIRDSVKQLS